MNNTELKVTSLADLQKYAGGSIVELPPFALGQPFIAKLRRPSMLVLVKSGKIPNSLMDKAQRLFANGGSDALNDGKYDGTAMNEMFNVLEIMCEATFVEPTYKELKDAGIQLTDDQMLFVFSYSQEGVKALDNFRK